MTDGKMGRAASYGELWTISKRGSLVADANLSMGSMMQRTAVCVNACAGMDDPAKEIARLRRAYQAAFRSLSLLQAAGKDSQLYGSVLSAALCLSEAFDD